MRERSQEYSDEELNKPDWVIIGIQAFVGVIAFLSIGTMVMIFFGHVTLTVSDSLIGVSNFVNGIISILLTLALVVLYAKQTSIAKGQRIVQENQEKLMESDHRPLIDLDHIFLGDNEKFGFSDNALIVGLLNIGNGVAYRPSLYIDLDFESNIYEYTKHEMMFRPLGKIKRENEQMYTNLKSSIPPDGNVHSYITPVYLKLQKGDEEILRVFEDILDTLFKADVESVQYEFYIEVKNIYGGSHEFPILKSTVTPGNFYTSSKEDSVPNSLFEVIYLSLMHLLSTGKTEPGVSLPYDPAISDKSLTLTHRNFVEGIKNIAEDYEEKFRGDFDEISKYLGREESESDD